MIETTPRQEPREFAAASPRQATARRRTIPVAALLGGLLVLAGLLADLAAHVTPLRNETLASASHWTVLVGMLLAVGGAISLGITQRGGRT